MQDVIESVCMIGLKLAAKEGVTQLIKTSVDTYIKPKLEKYLKDKKLQNTYNTIEENIIKYLHENYKRNLTMNTIVFKNQQKTINDLYIPLTLKKNNEMGVSKIEEYLVDSYQDKLISEYEKILIVDNAGMGKSTIIKYLYLMTITEKKGIPILIELRKLNKDTSIIQYILNEMNGIRYTFQIDHIIQLIKEGSFIFFLDGYDEIMQEAKSKITENLQEFISKGSKNKFVMASREESELSTFGDFQRFDIKPLTQEEAFELIKKYDLNGELSKELIEKLQTEENLKIIKEFLENPLMVSLLYKAFEYKKTIPYKKHLFYRQVYDALFEEHDLSKTGAFKRPKRCNLDTDDFHRILRTLGFITLKKGITYSQEELCKIIKDAKSKNIGIDFKASDFIYDIVHSVPIFMRDGLNYKWIHKSFQEYFAADYIYLDSKEKQNEILEIISKPEKVKKYYNVLDFYYDMDYKGFMKNIIYPIITEMEEFNRGRFLDEGYKMYNQNSLNIRKALDFEFQEIFFYRDSMGNEDTYFDILKDKLNKKNYSITNMTTFKSIKSCFSVAYKASNFSTLIKLLYYKKDNVIYRVKQTWNFTQILENINNLLESDIIYVVNDSIDNVLNKKDTFDVINCLLCRLGEKQILGTFDYGKCMEVKNKIEREIEEEKDNIDYL